ncbi:MAG TPA: hypothetical protein VFT08_06660, partial [Pyrinomonadaceae bacterium]|nr:hypothetical protein [Pyrinomonadaceae bacterium]
MKSAQIRVYVCSLFVVLVCSSYAFSQTTQTRLKLADGSYLTVDDAWESPQGVWYRQGGISHLLAKEKVKKIERTEPTTTSTTPTAASTNDDDHFEVAEAVAENRPTSGTYDKPSWIYLKGGARVEADSATQSP